MNRYYIVTGTQLELINSYGQGSKEIIKGIRKNQKVKLSPSELETMLEKDKPIPVNKDREIL